MKRVLLYRRGGLGDTLLTLPVAEVLCKSGYRVSFLGVSDYLPLLSKTGWIDEAYSAEYLDYFLERSFDWRIIISKDGTLSPFPEERIWLPYYYLDRLNLPRVFSYQLPKGQRGSEKSWRQRLVVIHPGSGSPKKNPPFSLFLKIEDLLRKRGFEVLFIGGEAEEWLRDLAVEALFFREILELTELLCKATLYIGNDSGVSHLASYLGLKTFIFFGPSDEVVFRPIGKEVQVLSLPLSCRPCFPNTCSEPECLQEEAIFSLFKRAFTQLIL